MEEQVPFLVFEYLAGDCGGVDGRGDFLPGREDADEQIQDRIVAVVAPVLRLHETLRNLPFPLRAE